MTHVIEERVRSAHLMVRFGKVDAAPVSMPKAELSPTVVDIQITGASLKRAFGNVDISGCTGTELALVSYDVTGCNSPVCLICPEDSLPGHNVIVDAAAPGLSCFAILYHGKPCEQMRAAPDNLSHSIISSMADDGRGMMLQTIRDCSIEDKKVYVPENSPVLSYLEHPLLPDQSDDDDDGDDENKENSDASEDEKQVTVPIADWEAAILGYLSHGRVVDLTKGFTLKALLLYGLPMTHQGVLEITLRTITGLKRAPSVVSRTTSREVITSPLHESSDSASPGLPWSGFNPEAVAPGQNYEYKGHSSSSSSVPEYAIRATSDTEQSVPVVGTSTGPVHRSVGASSTHPVRHAGAVPVDNGRRAPPEHDFMDSSGDDIFSADVGSRLPSQQTGHVGPKPVAQVPATEPETAATHVIPLDTGVLLHSSPLLSRWDTKLDAGGTSGSDENHLPVAPSDPPSSVDNSPVVPPSATRGGEFRGRDTRGNIVRVRPLPFDEQ